MGSAAAKQGDKVVATDIHVLMIPSPGGPVPTPTPMNFDGMLSRDLSTDVFIDGKAAALDGSVAENTPAHVPTGGPFQRPPSDEGKVMIPSRSTQVNGKPIARDGDIGITCNDPGDLPNGKVVASGSVIVGD